MRPVYCAVPDHETCVLCCGADLGRRDDVNVLCQWLQDLMLDVSPAVQEMEATVRPEVPPPGQTKGRKSGDGDIVP
jgi:hypothetical protein